MALLTSAIGLAALVAPRAYVAPIGGRHASAVMSADVPPIWQRGMSGEAAEKDAQVKSLTAELDIATSKLKFAVSEAESLVAQLHQTQAKLSQSEAQATAYSSQLTSTLKELAEKNSEASQARARASSLVSDLKKASERISVLSSRNALAEARLSATRDQLATAQADAEAVAAELKLLSSKSIPSLVAYGFKRDLGWQSEPRVAASATTSAVATPVVSAVSAASTAVSAAASNAAVSAGECVQGVGPFLGALAKHCLSAYDAAIKVVYASFRAVVMQAFAAFAVACRGVMRECASLLKPSRAQQWTKPVDWKAKPNWKSRNNILGMASRRPVTSSP